MLPFASLLSFGVVPSTAAPSSILVIENMITIAGLSMNTPTKKAVALNRNNLHRINIYVTVILTSPAVELAGNL